MRRLSHRDLHAVLECLQTVYATLDVETFPRQVVAALRRVVAAPFGSYNEINPRAARIKYVVEPAGALVSGLELSTRQYMHEQPALAHYVRTGDGSPRKLSDFLSRSEFHRLCIYAENYCRTGVEYQMTFMLHDRRKEVAATIAIALDRNRGGSDFSERDRLALSLLRPHLAAAHANAVMMSAMRRRGSPLADGPDTRRYETIVLTPGAWHALSQQARRWLTEYFDDGPLQRNRGLHQNL